MTRRLARFAALLIAAWCAMTLTHETGHLIGGWLSGATLVDAELRPWRLPHSLHQPNPWPLVTLWAGPLFGIAGPLLLAIITRRPSAWFIADFSLLANGVYLALGLLVQGKDLDSQRLLAAGAPWWTIAIFAAAAIGIGYPRFRRDCIRLLAPPTNPKELTK